MDQTELKAVFDRQAAGYAAQQQKIAPVHEGLYFQLQWLLADLPGTARILCVGLGAGAELAYLADRFPHWQFTAVEPSGAMLEVCRQRAEQEGFISRCTFYQGYVESLPDLGSYDAATCFMVSQFILDPSLRSQFFASIAARLKPTGILVSADLCSDLASEDYQVLLKAWVSMLQGAKAPADAIERTHRAWQKDVAILPQEAVKALVREGGFDAPVQFYQAGLVHAWFATRSAGAV